MNVDSGATFIFAEEGNCTVIYFNDAVTSCAYTKCVLIVIDESENYMRQ